MAGGLRSFQEFAGVGSALSTRTSKGVRRLIPCACNFMGSRCFAAPIVACSIMFLFVLLAFRRVSELARCGKMLTRLAHLRRSFLN